MAQQADHVIALHAGEERSIAATKNLHHATGWRRPAGGPNNADADMLAQLHAIPAQIEETLALNHHVDRIAERFCYAQNCVVIGRGFNYATAYEMALKMKELTYTVAELAQRQLIARPIGVNRRNFPAFVVAPSGVLTAEMKSFIYATTRTRSGSDRHQQ